MPFLPLFDVTYRPLNEDSRPILFVRAGQVPSPIGQPAVGFRLGFAQADRAAYMAGINVTVPISTGVRILAIRADGDYWRDVNSAANSNSGGTALSAMLLVGPSMGYFGGGPCVASRYGGASGPSGAGIKFVYGSQLALAIGYEFEFITTGKGSVAAITVNLHS